jgi:hypothetical protein
MPAPQVMFLDPSFGKGPDQSVDLIEEGVGKALAGTAV